MKLLIDTHIILWALDDNSKLLEQAKVLITDVASDVHLTAAIKCNGFVS